MTGIYTGRSPKKISTLLLMRTLRTLYGGHQMSIRTITTQCQKMYGLRLKDIAKAELSNKKLFVVDAFLWS